MSGNVEQEQAENVRRFKISRNFLDRKRELILTPSYLEFEEHDLKSTPFTRINKNEILSFRHGVHWIQLDMFTIGRSYQFFLKDIHGKVFKFALASLLRIGAQEHWETYKQVRDTLWEFYLGEKVGEFLDRFERGETLSFGPIIIRKDGIDIQSHTATSHFIEWEDLDFQDYPGNYVLFSHKAPHIRQSLYFLKDWNAEIIQAVVYTILRNKNLVTFETT